MSFGLYKRRKVTKLFLALGMIVCMVCLGGCARRASVPPGTTGTPEVEHNMTDSTSDSGDEVTDSGNTKQ
ncbi:MAG: hypothetical protein JXM70_13850 [Pirellulales bacterium]|nr:hypothetical protein [Pirellulales bacterium]